MKKSIFLFSLWFVLLSIPLAYMMGGHYIAFRPSNAKNLKELTDTKKEWNMVHFLGADCGCSEKVFKYLIERGPQKVSEEKIVIVGENADWLNAIKKRGFKVEMGSMDFFAKKFEIKAVPQLVIYHKDQLAYAGGYSNRRQPASTDFDDQKILQDLKNKKQTSELPIFGCANGAVNRRAIDPLGIKY